MLRSRARRRLNEFETAILSAMPPGRSRRLVVLAIAAAAFGNEIEDRTLANSRFPPCRAGRSHCEAARDEHHCGAFIVVSSVPHELHCLLADTNGDVGVDGIGARRPVALYSSAFVWLASSPRRHRRRAAVHRVWEGFFWASCPACDCSAPALAIAVMTRPRRATVTNGDTGPARGDNRLGGGVRGLSGAAVRRLRRMERS